MYSYVYILKIKMLGISEEKRIAHSYVDMAYGEGGGGLKASPFGLLPL